MKIVERTITVLIVIGITGTTGWLRAMHSFSERTAHYRPEAEAGHHSNRLEIVL